MSAGPTLSTPALSHRFADALPELALDWAAEAAPEPRLLVLDESLAVELGLDPDWLRSPAGLRLLTGEEPPPGARPVAMGYAGHQFGGWSPRLGDGRALLLGELTDTEGRLRDLHLKGSGRTPWSRGGDGLAAVGPMLREHVISGALHALGVPTTRSLAVVATGRTVRREVPLPGAVLARVASSHLRVGTFQYAAQQAASTGDLDLLRRLCDHAIARHHPAAAERGVPALGLLDAVVGAQASLVAAWMQLGFVHGVLNTDNVTISGESIDFGPCAWLDGYDTRAVFSSIDDGGRYAFGNQPPVTQWNLARFAEALLPLIDEDQERAVALAVEVLETFGGRYGSALAAGESARLGLPAGLPDDVVVPLVEEMLGLLQASRVDLTGFRRDLATAARGDAEPVRGRFLDLPGLDAWLARWRALGPDPDAMDAINPVYVPRNHLVQEALDAATAGDLTPFDTLTDVLADPFTPRAGLDRYALPTPDGSGPFVTYCGT